MRPPLPVIHGLKTPHFLKFKSQYLLFGDGSFYALKVVPEVICQKRGPPYVREMSHPQKGVIEI